MDRNIIIVGYLNIPISIKNISVQFHSIIQSCLTLCDPMNHSTPGLPIHHQLPESTQTHVHRVGDAIQLSHPLLSPSPPAFNLSQHQGLFNRQKINKNNRGPVVELQCCVSFKCIANWLYVHILFQIIFL